MGTPETDTLKEKIFQLEALNKRMVEAMDAMVAISDYQRDIQAIDTVDEIYKIASQKFTKITPLRFAAFFSINEEMNFNLSYSEPANLEDHIQEEFSKQMQSGVLAWALNSERAVTVKPETEFIKAGNADLIVCPLEANKGILGLFIAQPEENPEDMHQLEMMLMNVALVATTLALENAQLTQNLKEANQELENKVQARTEKLKMALTQAEKATKAKSEFLATMSHEIRTPMNGVLGMCELLMETELKDHQYTYANVIHNSGKALLTVINDILDFSKIEAGKLELEMIPFELRTNIEEVVDVLAPRAAEKGIDLIADIDCHLPKLVLGDGMRLRQILLNLASNAIKFTSQGNVLFKISQVLRQRDETIINFEVEDTGIGIPPEKQARLFQSFSQVDSSTSRKFGGTGLGLAISQSLCNMMGGEISVTSIMNDGSTFRFTLKMKIDDKSTVKKEAALRSKKVIIATENIKQASVIQRYLTWHECEIQIQNSATSLTSLLAQGKPYDYLLIDYALLSKNPDETKELIELCKKRCDDIILLKPMTLSSELSSVEMLFDKSITKPVKFDQVVGAMLNKEISRNINIDKFRMPEGRIWKILLVDDDRTNLQVASIRLEKMNIRITKALSGQEALDHFKRFHFDLIFMDCNMPEMDGFETTKMIRDLENKNKVEKPTPVIALSANAMEDEDKRCYLSGMDDYLTKPIILKELIAVLTRWLLKGNVNFEEEEVPEEELKDVVDLKVIRDLLGGENYDMEQTLLKTFLDDSSVRYNELKQALVEGDCKKTNYLSHTIKGGAGNIGIHCIYDTCKAIEKLSESQNLNPIEVHVKRLEIDLQRLRKFFQANYGN
ncbi:MAG: ATP-binding protein [Lentisphaeraceae bacterium]|nr:ATP-binding protein [Lentisphaeraceae bacterium]